MSGTATAQPFALQTTERGFTLEQDDTPVIAATAEKNGWTIGTHEGVEWFLRELHDQGRGFVLEDRTSSTRRGQTSRLATVGSDRAAVSIILDDGRGFSIAPRVSRHPGFDLTGWAGPGPYWQATRSEDGWILAPTAAGRMLEASEALIVLFAAEVLAADRD